MDEIDININKVISLVNEFNQYVSEKTIKDTFTKVAKNLLECYYSIRKDPHASIYRRKVADTILSQNGFPSLLANALTLCLNQIQLTSKVFDDMITTLEAFKAAAFLQAAILNFSDCSSIFSRALVENKAYIHCNQVILKNVAVERQLFTPDKSILYFLKCTLNCVYNLLKYRGDEARAIFNEADYVSLIQRYTTSTAVDVKSTSSIILTYLVKEDQVSDLVTDEMLNYILSTLNSAFIDGPKRSTGFDTIELCLCLQELVKNDAVCQRILNQGALPILKQIFKAGTQKQKCSACYVLLGLSSNQEARPKIKKEFGSMFSLDLHAMAKSNKNTKNDDGLFDYIALKSWLLENTPVSIDEHDERPPDWIRNLLKCIYRWLSNDERVQDTLKLGNFRHATKPHLMISYKHTNGDIAKIITLAAKSAGFEVWVDTEKMMYEDGIYESMANAIENSFAVCILYSEDYKRSQNTRAEAQYAYDLQKPMIFCRTTTNYIPDGWLGLFFAGKVYIDFSGKRSISEAEKQLVDKLKKYWNKHGAMETNVSNPKFKDDKKNLKMYGNDKNMRNVLSDEGSANKMAVFRDDPRKKIENNMIGSSSLEAETSEWSNIQVENWMVNKNIFMEKKEPLVGEDLLFLKKLQKDAPAFFFKLITKHWKVKSIQDLRAISTALEEL